MEVNNQPLPNGVQRERRSIWGSLRYILITVFLLYIVTTIVRPTPDSSEIPEPKCYLLSSIYPKGTVLNVHAYLSKDESSPIFREGFVSKHLVYGNRTNGLAHRLETTITVPEYMKNNGSAYLHIFIVENGNSPNPNDRKYVSRTTIHQSKRLNIFKKIYHHQTRNLITGMTAVIAEKNQKANNLAEEILSFWHPNITINILDEQLVWNTCNVPSIYNEYLRYDLSTGIYYPIVYIDNYWNLMKDYQLINNATEELALVLNFQTPTLFELHYSISQQNHGRWTAFLGLEINDKSDELQDHYKEMCYPNFKIIQYFACLLNIVCLILYMKHSIQFWNKRQSLRGLSVRLVFYKAVEATMIQLYYFNIDEKRAFSIEQSVCFITHLWIINNAVDIHFERVNRWLGIIPKIIFADKRSYVDSSTKEFDVMASKYLIRIFTPVLAVYAGFTIIFLEHRGWYSWLLSTMFDFFAVYGFFAIIPQLFINYKLKSVDHLPWRMMFYHFIGTILNYFVTSNLNITIISRPFYLREVTFICVSLYQNYIYGIPSKISNSAQITGDESDDAKKED